MEKKLQEKASLLDRFLDTVERVCNKLPPPAILFGILFVITAIVGALCTQAGFALENVLFETAAVLKAKPAELREKAEQNMAELREMRHTVEKFQAREAAGETERFPGLEGDWGRFLG